MKSFNWFMAKQAILIPNMGVKVLLTQLPLYDDNPYRNIFYIIKTLDTKFCL